jgi:uncharacterized membrane protein
MKTRTTTSYPYLMIAYAFIGLSIAIYDCYMIYTGQLLWCPPPIDGCNEVAYSPYGRIHGIPIGYFGIFFYSIMLALGAILVFLPASRGLRRAAVIYTALGVCGSIAFAYLDVTLIRAFCVYCLISAILTVLLLLSAIAHSRVIGRDHSFITARGISAA